MRKILAVLLSAVLLCSCSSPSGPRQNLVAESDISADAHWIAANTILIRKANNAVQFELHGSSTESVSIARAIAGETRALPLRPATNSAAKSVKVPPHLRDWQVLSLGSGADIRQLLKGSLLVLQMDANGNVIKASVPQTGFVLDDIYVSGDNDADEAGVLGALVSGEGVTFKLWAPTATAVEVLLFNRALQPLPTSSLTMSEDPATGIWSARGGVDLTRAFYQYRVTVYHPETSRLETLDVSDPYSLSLSSNGVYSQVVDLDAGYTQPSAWLEQNIPVVDAPEDLILYESHIRDFSASDTKLSNPAFRGKYKAFGERNSDGIRHLLALKEAGLNTVHLLPTYDIGTVNEDSDQVVFPTTRIDKLCSIEPGNLLCDTVADKSQSLHEVLAQFDVRSADAQAVLETLRPYDPYNWGYDPVHYTVPEGSYALNPDGEARIVEFREMVRNIHNMGFRVIMDVVYNHTYKAGLHRYSVLDKIVPGYYHRLNPVSGAIEQSTCCDNTATERRMMGKLMIDSLIVWARDYKIDGFRFDLMGHQPKALMLEAREAVRKVDPDTYFYGEGWNFGEVANGAQFEQATQVPLAGSEIGTFTDRLRDAVRGGSFGHSGRYIRAGQGLANGLKVIPNDEASLIDIDAEYANSMDQARVGLAGNLANYAVIDSEGNSVLGKDVDYGGGPTGYALDPADTVNYVSKHDNQTLWDSNQYRTAYALSSADRARMQSLGLAYAIYAQGVPFLHMGSELLRSKSFLRDSYDYGDWFNAVDFSMQGNNYDVGLPPAVKDKDNWPLISDVLNNNEGRDKVGQSLIQQSAEMFKSMLKIRSGSPLFRLRTASEIRERLRFHNTGPGHVEGLIVMSLDDGDFAEDLDPANESIVVVFNNSGESASVPFSGAGHYALHPALLGGADTVVKQARADADLFTVPALTVAVFVR